MEFTQQIALLSAISFFLFGLVTGVWKYVWIHRNPDAKAPVYVDICHRSSLLYAFACLLLERMVEVSKLPHSIEVPALIAPIVFFGLAVTSYAIHGLLQDTDNQLQKPHRLGRYMLPTWVMQAFMAALIITEIGGTMVLAVGVVLAL
ncbi:MAG: hypothetical protein HOI23_20875 [Deltaproteobacteria bacterium]|jgi:hypothetical protein|nr:hypothetical protein [Deltaproteobacteria bacterium]MBT6433831.1 hypothetical protein [Deltaproteobacteria bacterium]MBT6491535.1 hypothetical protein [Deltaproteobacteria bacterium]